MAKVRVNEGYEIYQIVTDFGNPLEIFREAIQNSFDAAAKNIYICVVEQRSITGDKLVIDIIDDGSGLNRDNVSSFFDVANSTKVSEDYIPIGQHGYKGHGSKVFFNAEEVIVCSKTRNDNWAVSLIDPLNQISQNHELHYSDFVSPESLNISIPDDWVSGFRIRIIAPKHFATNSTKAKLKHIVLRDYCRWFTIIGSVETAYNDTLRDCGVKLYLSGLLKDAFKSKFNTIEMCDPVPSFVATMFGEFEEIKIGHYFPPERTTDNSMKAYARSINSSKPYYNYYSKMIYNDIVTVGSISFRFIISLEGYDTKRCYDLLLSSKGRGRDESQHTDGSRYGIWACKGGVPVEKVDDWYTSGRGVGTYTYMQAFIDCNEFQLTANRGSVQNTDIDKLEAIKAKVNEILESRVIKKALSERQDWEDMEKTLESIENDGRSLQKRFRESQSRRRIILPNGVELLEPSKQSTGYSESETFVVLLSVMQQYPKLFKFKLMDYNTTKGIDFVVADALGNPRYIELKGTLNKSINHPFRYIYKFICYDINVPNNDLIQDLEEFKLTMSVNDNDSFESNIEEFNRKQYTSYILQSNNASVGSIEVICLKSFLTEVLGATIR